jgi:hypothetical protein
MSHVASNIHVAGGRNAFSQKSLSNMQIARLAVLEVNEKMRGRCAATKAFRHEGAQPWAAPLGDVSPNRLGVALPRLPASIFLLQ